MEKRSEGFREGLAITPELASYRGDELLFGIILDVLAFWLFAQTTLNIAPAMAVDLGVTTNA